MCFETIAVRRIPENPSVERSGDFYGGGEGSAYGGLQKVGRFGIMGVALETLGD